MFHSTDFKSTSLQFDALILKLLQMPTFKIEKESFQRQYLMRKWLFRGTESSADTSYRNPIL